ncbi:unnamed protein product [Linum tenue]|uniref:Transmembrane protein n=1 Tax=Linum tenue TaxID=586396 RepID=A0AAV0NBT2_9ROSI|nr:unnamed protein product [Linum tenue]
MATPQDKRSNFRSRQNFNVIKMALMAAGLSTLFPSMVCFVLGAWIYVMCTDGLTVQDFFTPWMAGFFVDFYIYVFPFALWVLYKESNLLLVPVWILLLICTGSMGAGSFTFVQFLKLSPQEAADDPIYHALLRPEHKYGSVLLSVEVQKGKQQHSPMLVVAACIVFTSLVGVMIATLICSVVIQGSPFRKEILTPAMAANLIDMCANFIALSVWVAYKETSWLSASLWIAVLILPGGIAAYIATQLFQLSSHDPLYLVLVKKNRSRRATRVPLLSSAKPSAQGY